jgi:hypothetical protein
MDNWIEFRWVYTVLVCGPAAAVSALFLLGGWLRRNLPKPKATVGRLAADAAGADGTDTVAAVDPAESPDTPQGRRLARRRLGAGLVLVIAVTFFIGVNRLTPSESPTAYLAIWGVMGIMLLWLLALAAMDIRQNLAEHSERLRRLRERFGKNTDNGRPRE